MTILCWAVSDSPLLYVWGGFLTTILWCNVCVTGSVQLSCRTERYVSAGEGVRCTTILYSLCNNPTIQGIEYNYHILQALLYNYNWRGVQLFCIPASDYWGYNHFTWQRPMGQCTSIIHILKVVQLFCFKGAVSNYPVLKELCTTILY